jgi:hypothetical protein
MQTYYQKRKYLIGFTLLFTISLIAGVYEIFSEFYLGIQITILSLILIYIFTQAKPKITIDENQIYKKVFNKEEIYNWEWIYAIKTEKSTTTGYYTTHVYWVKSNDEQLKSTLLQVNKNKEQIKKLIDSKQIGSIIISSHFTEYEQILAQIVSKTKDIEIDETTRKIIEKVKLNN